MAVNLKEFNISLLLIALFVGLFSLQVTHSGFGLSQALLFPSSLYFIYYFHKSQKIRFQPSQIFLILFILFGYLSLIANYSNLDIAAKSFFKIRYYIAGILPCWGFYYLLKNPKYHKYLKSILYGFIGFTLVVIVVSIYLAHKASVSRVVGFYNAMIFGYGMGLYCTIALAAWANRPDDFFIPKWALRSLAIIMVIVLFWSNTRGPIIGVACALPFVFMFRGFKPMAIAAAISSTLLVLIIYSGMGDQKSKISRLFSSYQTNSSYIRLSQYHAGWELMKERPLLGHGNLQYQIQIKRIKKQKKIKFPKFTGDAHSQTFQLLAEHGLIGFFLFCGWFFCWLRELYQNRDYFSKIMIPFAISGAVSFQFYSLSTDNHNNYFVMLLYALSSAFILQKGTPSFSNETSLSDSVQPG